MLMDLLFQGGIFYLVYEIVYLVYGQAWLFGVWTGKD